MEFQFPFSVGTLIVAHALAWLDALLQESSFPSLCTVMLYYVARVWVCFRLVYIEDFNFSLIWLGLVCYLFKNKHKERISVKSKIRL